MRRGGERGRRSQLDAGFRLSHSGGTIIAPSKVGTPPGEFRLVTNVGDIAITDKAKIIAKGETADPFSASFWVEAGSGSLTADGKIITKAKAGAYAFNLEADQNVLLGPKFRLKAMAKETGTEVAINSQSADVRVKGKAIATVKDVAGGDGARVHICAATSSSTAARRSTSRTAAGTPPSSSARATTPASAAPRRGRSSLRRRMAT